MIRYHEPTEEQKIKIQEAFDERSSTWEPKKWDYTEWEEFFYDVKIICGVGAFDLVNTSFLKMS